MDLSAVWGSFVMQRATSEFPYIDLTKIEALELLSELYAEAVPTIDSFRDATFDERFTDAADLIVGKLAHGEYLAGSPAKGWRIVHERFVLAVAAYSVPPENEFIIRLPTSLSRRDRAAAILLRDLLGPARSIPRTWPGRQQPAVVLEFPSGARLPP